MSKPKVYDLASVIRAELDKRVGFVLKVDDTHSMTIPPPILWPDKALRGDIYTDEAVRQIIGADQQDAYDAFEAAGGTGKLLLQLVTEHYGADLPE
jgi:hypothetical protein